MKSLIYFIAGLSLSVLALTPVNAQATDNIKEPNNITKEEQFLEKNHAIDIKSKETIVDDEKSTNSTVPTQLSSHLTTTPSTNQPDSSDTNFKAKSIATNPQANASNANASTKTGGSANTSTTPTPVHLSQNYNFRSLLYNAAITVYPDLQLASTQNTQNQVIDFVDKSVGMGLFMGMQGKNRRVYAATSYVDTFWRNSFASSNGQQYANNISVGYHARTHQMRYGIAGIFSKESSSENFNYKQLVNNLSRSESYTTGLAISLGQMLDTGYYAFGIFSAYHHFDVTRTLLDLNQVGKVNAIHTGLIIRFGYSILKGENYRLTGFGGFTSTSYYSFKFAEQVSKNPYYVYTKKPSVSIDDPIQVLAREFKFSSLHITNRYHLDTYVILGLKYSYDFRIKGFLNQIDFQSIVQKSLTPVNFDVDKSNLTSASYQLTNEFITKVKLNYRLNFTEDTHLDIYGIYMMCSNWFYRNVGASFTYSF